VEVTGGCYYFLFEKKIVKLFVQCHVFAQSRPGRGPNEKFPLKNINTYSNPDAQINCIEVTDQKENGTGGYTRIVSGGVGHNNVTIHFESQFTRGFSFVMKIYGQ
jgi:hypothetical protein